MRAAVERVFTSMAEFGASLGGRGVEGGREGGGGGGWEVAWERRAVRAVMVEVRREMRPVLELRRVWRRSFSLLRVAFWLERVATLERSWWRRGEPATDFREVREVVMAWFWDWRASREVWVVVSLDWRAVRVVVRVRF